MRFPGLCKSGLRVSPDECTTKIPGVEFGFACHVCDPHDLASFEADDGLGGRRQRVVVLAKVPVAKRLLAAADSWGHVSQSALAKLTFQPGKSGNF